MEDAYCNLHMRLEILDGFRTEMCLQKGIYSLVSIIKSSTLMGRNCATLVNNWWFHDFIHAWSAHGII